MTTKSVTIDCVILDESGAEILIECKYGSSWVDRSDILNLEPVDRGSGPSGFEIEIPAEIAEERGLTAERTLWGAA